MTEAEEERQEEGNDSALAQILSQLTTLSTQVGEFSNRLASVEGVTAGTNARLAALEAGNSQTSGSGSTVEGEDPDDNLIYVPHFAQQNPYPVRPPTAPEKPILYELTTDPVGASLRERKGSSLWHEYKLLAPVCSYMHDAKFFFEGTLLTEERRAELSAAELQERTEAFYNTFTRAMAWLSKRYSLLQVRSRVKAGDENEELVKYLEEQVYGSLGGLEVASGEINALLKQFEKRKITQMEKRAAQRAAGTQAQGKSYDFTPTKPKKSFIKDKDKGTPQSKG